MDAIKAVSGRLLRPMNFGELLTPATDPDSLISEETGGLDVAKYMEPKTIPEAPSEALGVQSKGLAIEDVSALGIEECTSTHQENKRRRAVQRRYRRKRPSSFDASLIVRNLTKTGMAVTRVVSSTPSTLTRQQAPAWNDSSASSSTSSEDSDLDVRPDKAQVERRIADNSEAKLGSEEYAMSAAEEAAFRMTVGRGHFSRSKKDRFLNHLRLEKRLNREFFEFAYRSHTRTQDVTPVI